MPLSVECRCGASRSSSWKILLSRVMLWGIGTNHVYCFDWIIGRIPGDLYVSYIPPPPPRRWVWGCWQWNDFHFSFFYRPCLNSRRVQVRRGKCFVSFLLQPVMSVPDTSDFSKRIVCHTDYCLGQQTLCKLPWQFEPKSVAVRCL